MREFVVKWLVILGGSAIVYALIDFVAKRVHRKRQAEMQELREELAEIEDKLSSYDNADIAFSGIRDEWKQLLERTGKTTSLEWSDEPPVILHDEGLPFLFKEFKWEASVEVDYGSKPSTAQLFGNGYAVTIRDGQGGWRPSEVRLLEQDSAEDAMAEMRRLRQKG